MPQPLDEDMANTINAEAYAEYLDTKERKNQILAMHDTMQKQRLWQRLFGTVKEPDDSYLKGEVF